MSKTLRVTLEIEVDDLPEERRNKLDEGEPMPRLAEMTADEVADVLSDLDAFSETLDWKASPDDVLEAVDAQLRQFGLMVFQRDTGSDDCAFTIIRKRRT